MPNPSIFYYKVTCKRVINIDTYKPIKALLELFLYTLYDYVVTFFTPCFTLT